MVWSGTGDSIVTVDAMRAVLFAVVGLAFGSFLTVVVHRLPRGESVVRPRSACPNCGTQIRPRDNVPVISWIILRGRCRTCLAGISAEYPVVEGLTGALFVASILVFDDTATALMVGLFLGVMVAAALIDARNRIIPNRLTYPALGVFLVAVAVVWATGGDVDPVRAVLGLLVYGGALFVLALLSPGGMGMGDVKLAALVGLVLGALGWSHVGVAVLVAVLAGGMGALLALAMGRGRKDAIPFGPYLAGGAVVSALAAPQIAAWYAGLIA
jgi:leader peptidase (prepilin peptidase) / N-methyltransferase